MEPELFRTLVVCVVGFLPSIATIVFVRGRDMWARRWMVYSDNPWFIDSTFSSVTGDRPTVRRVKDYSDYTRCKYIMECDVLVSNYLMFRDKTELTKLRLRGKKLVFMEGVTYETL